MKYFVQIVVYKTEKDHTILYILLKINTYLLIYPKTN